MIVRMQAIKQYFADMFKSSKPVIARAGSEAMARIKAVEQARRVAPVFLSIHADEVIATAGQTVELGRTKELLYPVRILGAISSVVANAANITDPDREFQLILSSNRRISVFGGYIKRSAFAAQAPYINMLGGGDVLINPLESPFLFPCEIPLPTQVQMLVQPKPPVYIGETKFYGIMTFIGVRVMDNLTQKQLLDDEERAALEEQIASTAQELRIIPIAINLDKPTDNILAPHQDEDLLILGFRTTMLNCSIEVTDARDVDWTPVNGAHINALCAYEGDTDERYRPLVVEQFWRRRSSLKLAIKRLGNPQDEAGDPDAGKDGTLQIIYIIAKVA